MRKNITKDLDDLCQQLRHGLFTATEVKHKILILFAEADDHDVETFALEATRRSAGEG